MSRVKAWWQRFVDWWAPDIDAPPGLVIYDSKGRMYTEDQIAAILKRIEEDGNQDENIR